MSAPLHADPAAPTIGPTWKLQVTGPDDSRSVQTVVTEGRAIDLAGQQSWSCRQFPIRRLRAPGLPLEEMVEIACFDGSSQFGTFTSCSFDRTNVAHAVLRTRTDGKSYMITIDCRYTLPSAPRRDAR